VSRENCITTAHWEPLVNIISEVIRKKHVYKYTMTCLLYKEIKNIVPQKYAFLRLFCSWFVGRLQLSAAGYVMSVTWQDYYINMMIKTKRLENE